MSALSFLWGSSIFWCLTLVYFGLAVIGAFEAYDGYETWPGIRRSLEIITAIYVLAVAAIAAILSAWA